MYFKEMADWALGPSGVRILNWYVENNLLVNGLIVAIGLWAVFFPRQRERVSAVTRAWWRKSPLAPREKDQTALDRFHARRRSARGRSVSGRKT